jgi:hypothetical protein
VYPKVSGLVTWSENCKWYSSLPLGEFYRYLVGTETSNTKDKRIFRYRLSPETFGYTLVLPLPNTSSWCGGEYVTSESPVRNKHDAKRDEASL